jgi:hypothetical protein
LPKLEIDVGFKFGEGEARKETFVKVAGRTAVVTGGGGGIGGAIAVRLVEPGARVVVAAATKAVTSAGAVLTPEAVAELVLEAVDDERFLILPHPEVLEMYRRKGADYEKWLSGMRRYQAGLLAAR